MACIIWWFLLGLLIGLLLFWLIDKLFRRTGESQLESCQAECQRLKDRVAELSVKDTQIKETVEELVAPSTFGFVPQSDGRDNLKIIEGIGPKIEELLINAGVTTFAILARKDANELSQILEAAGPRFKLANPKSWPAQAELCEKKDWAALNEYQDYLDGGVDIADRQNDS